MKRQLEVSDLLWWGREEVVKALVYDQAKKPYKLPKKGMTFFWYAITRKHEVITLGAIDMYAILYRGLMSGEIKSMSDTPDLTPETALILNPFIEKQAENLLSPTK